jgi:hypothetical protein
MDNIRFMAQRCAKRVLSSTEIQLSNGWFSAECRPPVPARKVMTGRAHKSGGREKTQNASVMQPQSIYLDCGGKRSATPFWKLCPHSKSGVAAALQSSLHFASAGCHRSPKSSRTARRNVPAWRCLREAIAGGSTGQN